MPLTAEETAFLKDLERYLSAHNEESRLLKYPTHPAVKSLAERGYVQIHCALSGPLGIPPGEETISLTDAGVEAISDIANFRFVGDFSEGPIESLLLEAQAAGIITEYDTGRGRIVWANGKPGAEFERLEKRIRDLVNGGES